MKLYKINLNQNDLNKLYQDFAMLIDHNLDSFFKNFFTYHNHVIINKSDKNLNIDIFYKYNESVMHERFPDDEMDDDQIAMMFSDFSNVIDLLIYGGIDFVDQELMIELLYDNDNIFKGNVKMFIDYLVSFIGTLMNRHGVNNIEKIKVRYDEFIEFIEDVK